VKAQARAEVSSWQQQLMGEQLSTPSGDIKIEIEYMTSWVFRWRSLPQRSRISEEFLPFLVPTLISISFA
jgi:hypothetical protein